MDAYSLGEAAVFLTKSAASTPKTSYGLKGKLYLSNSGWILMSVPNAIGNGAFAALSEPGVEQPTQGDGDYNAHVSVMRPEELEAAGLTPADITERGKEFSYTLGPVRTVNPAGWSEMSKVWYIDVVSPELKNLRKSYGLTPLPKNNDHQFHISFAVRRTGVMGRNDTSKAASIADLMKLSSGPHGKTTTKPCTYSARQDGTCTNRSPRVKDRSTGGGSGLDSVVAVADQAKATGPDLSGATSSGSTGAGGAGGGGGGGGI